MQIIPARKEDRKQVMNLYAAVTRELRNNGIYQWDRFYPNRFVVGADLKERHLFGIRQGDAYIGAIALDEKQSSNYAKLRWEDCSGRVLCIHRLAVHPGFQGQGLGKKLLHFAEAYAQLLGYSSIRLDVYTGNPTAVGMYERAGYRLRGEITFPFRPMPYQCFEKLLG